MPLTIKDALRLAAKDPQFAHELVTKPDSLKHQFGLTDAHVAELKRLGVSATAAIPHLGPVADYD